MRAPTGNLLVEHPPLGFTGGQPSGAEHKRRPRGLVTRQIYVSSFTVCTRVRLVLRWQNSCSYMEAGGGGDSKRPRNLAYPEAVPGPDQRRVDKTSGPACHAKPLRPELAGPANHADLAGLTSASSTHNLPKMRFHGLPFVSLLFSVAVAQEDFDFSSCRKEDADVEKCSQKIDTVVEIAPGTSYLTKIACKDCPYAETWNEDSDDGKPESRMTHGDQELVRLPHPGVMGWPFRPEASS